MIPNALRDILHWLAIYATKDDDQDVILSILEGQANEQDEEDQRKQEELEPFIRQQMPSFET